MKKIGMIGMGSIGTHFYEQFQRDGFEVVFIYARNRAANAEYDHLVISTPEELEQHCQQGVDLVVEAATADAVKTLAPIVLQYTDMAALSSTALADATFHQQVEQLCKKHQTTLYIPHGAVMGLDGVMDARDVLKTVTITTTKSPKSLGRNNQQREVIYAGPTRAACEQFPRNVNVHATLALAGLGFDKTRSVLVADPDIQVNRHHIEVEGAGFSFEVLTNSSIASQVSSLYTLISAYSAIKRTLSKKEIVII